MQVQLGHPLSQSVVRSKVQMKYPVLILGIYKSALDLSEIKTNNEVHYNYI